MLFKNLLVYRFTQPFTLDPESLHQHLDAKPFRPCGSQELSTLGWVAPVGDGDAPLVHAANGCLMVCLQRQSRLLPAAVVNDALAERVAEIEAREARRPGKKERTDLKDEITFELLPRAFTRTGRLYAYIDPRAGLLVVNSGAHNRAEDLLSQLRESLGSLPVLPLKTRDPIPTTLTQWLRDGAAPAGFTLGGECELRDSADDSAVIRCKNQDLGSEEIRNHLDAGMYVSKLALEWCGDIAFLVDDKLAVKRLKFGDLINDKLGEVNAESAAEQFDVDFTIMTGEFAVFIPALLDALGGEEGVTGGEPGGG
ncbi:MAG: recombination-associated protein RdgC [Porticoccaceae bacterium]